jgi:hypothetical protein
METLNKIASMLSGTQSECVRKTDQYGYSSSCFLRTAECYVMSLLRESRGGHGKKMMWPLLSGYFGNVLKYLVPSRNLKPCTNEMSATNPLHS